MGCRLRLRMRMIDQAGGKTLGRKRNDVIGKARAMVRLLSSSRSDEMVNLHAVVQQRRRHRSRREWLCLPLAAE